MSVLPSYPQHPAHRLRLSQILSHPFMKEHGQGQHQQPSSSSLHKAHIPNHQLIRGVHPSSQASVDSGHATQYTMSSSSQSHFGRGGPMRATVRPHGIEDHIPPSHCSTSSLAGNHRSRHQSLTSPTHDNSSNQPYTGHRRTQSVDGVSTSTQAGPSHNYSSTHQASLLPQGAPAIQGRGQSSGQLKQHSLSCEELRTHNKENRSNTNESKSRKAKSDVNPLGPNRYSQHQRSISTIPFKDRTNTATQGGSVPRSTASKEPSDLSVTTGHGGGTLKELVPPLNAARLRPIQQQTRSAIVSPV